VLPPRLAVALAAAFGRAAYAPPLGLLAVGASPAARRSTRPMSLRQRLTRSLPTTVRMSSMVGTSSCSHLGPESPLSVHDDARSSACAKS
jgi:hypothetical protein